jgi:hypothetical protein
MTLSGYSWYSGCAIQSPMSEPFVNVMQSGMIVIKLPTFLHSQSDIFVVLVQSTLVIAGVIFRNLTTGEQATVAVREVNEPVLRAFGVGIS